MEVAHGQPLHRREEEVRERQRGRRPLGVEVLPARARRRAAPRRPRPPPGRRAAAPGSARATRAARAATRIGSKCEPSREICSPWTSVTESTSPFAVDQTACVMFPRSKRPLPNARCRRTASAPKPAANAAVASQTNREGVIARRAARPDRATARRAPPRSRAPGRRRARRRRSARASAASPASRRTAAASASGSPAGTSSALSPSTSSSRAAGVSAVTSGVPQASAWNALFGITRPVFAEVPKTPSAHPARWSSSGSRSYSTHSTHSTLGGRSRSSAVELAAADDAERHLRREPRGREDRLDAVERDQLADEERVELLRRLPAGPEEALLGADEADRQPLGRELAQLGEDAARSARCRRRRGRRAGARAGRPGAGHPRRASRPRSGRDPRRASRGARRAG